MHAEHLILISLLGLLMVGCAQNRPRSSGLETGQLQPCPDSPNCVSSQSTDTKHRIEPLRYDGPPGEAIAELRDVIQSMKRARIVKDDERYMHAEFRSAVFRFVDDVEFYQDAENGLIHVRSASRVGYYDFGVNRKRVERIRSMFQRR